MVEERKLGNPPALERAPGDVSSMVAAFGVERFGFGENWKSFLDEIDDIRVAEAEKSLQWLLGRDRIDGLSFLDIGSGSGLSSLSARRLGAAVRSFDYDPQSVESTTILTVTGQWPGLRQGCEAGSRGEEARCSQRIGPSPRR